MKNRETWQSRMGFIFAALGSAVGLGSIWRFPYIVGENGGAVFILLYVICLLLIGFPVLLSEIVIGRSTQTSPCGAYKQLGKSSLWASAGKTTIFTGFLISSFYSVIAGWSLGYLIESLLGRLTTLTSSEQALGYFTSLSSDPSWAVGFHFFFICLSLAILLTGVRKGIEAGSKIMMPLLFFVLLILVFQGLTMKGAMKGLSFLFSPDFSQITPKVVLMALGQAFFTLSLGQGTMVTYGSYLSKKENIVTSCVPVVLLNTFISILMGIAIFCIVFSMDMSPSSGAALIFETLPIIFSQMPWGEGLAILFFLLVTLAALTSEISALEPMIAYLMDEKGLERKKAVFITGLGAFILGVPTALSFSLIKNDTLLGMNFYELISFATVNLLVPIGGLFAALLVGWKWGVEKAYDHLRQKKQMRASIFKTYFFISVKYLVPILIILILLDILGVY